MSSWISNVGAGLLVLLLGYLLRATRERWATRGGPLAGLWVWVTYAPIDLDKSQAIWSIEICRLRQRRGAGGNDISGTLWRLFDRETPTRFERRWAISGRHDGDVVEGVYWATRDRAGSHGVFHVWKVDPTLFEGKYVRVVGVPRAGHLMHSREEAWTEWVRLPAVISPAFRRVLARIPRNEAARLYPLGLRRHLGMEGGILRSMARGFASSAALTDSRLLSEQIRSERDEQDRVDRSPMTLHRWDLGLLPSDLSVVEGGAPDEKLPVTGTAGE